MKDILSNIREIRQKLGYSQEYVAKGLNMSQNGYSLIEKGSRNLNYNDLHQIAIIFNMSVIDVIAYPDKWLPVTDISERGEPKVTIQIELNREKKDQVLKLAFGENILEILNK
jgi:transcriptional regulator with XRE-family HTH domain